MALCKDKNSAHPYVLYFVNNSQNPIDVLIVIPPGVKSRIPPNAKINDLLAIKGLEKFYNLPFLSFKMVARFQDWEFDWSIQRDVFLQSCGKEKHLPFCIDKYRWNLEEVADLPVLHRPGWICL